MSLSIFPTRTFYCTEHVLAMWPYQHAAPRSCDIRSRPSWNRARGGFHASLLCRVAVFGVVLPEPGIPLLCFGSSVTRSSSSLSDNRDPARYHNDSTKYRDLRIGRSLNDSIAIHIPLVSGANNPRTESLITRWCGKAVSRSRRPYIAAFCMACYYSFDATRGLGSTKSAENDMLYMYCIS